MALASAVPAPPAARSALAASIACPPSACVCPLHLRRPFVPARVRDSQSSHGPLRGLSRLGVGRIPRATTVTDALYVDLASGLARVGWHCRVAWPALPFLPQGGGPDAGTEDGVIVVGAGLAGLACAVKLAERGVKV